MPVTLMDPAKMEELAQIVDVANKDSALEDFIHSLALPEGEAGAVISSLAQLPPCGPDRAAVPRKAPDLVRMALWG